MAAASGIEVVGLKELRAACRSVNSALPREVTKALRAAGVPALAKVRGYAQATTGGSRSTGNLLKSYKIRTAGASASVASGVPYGAGAEWGLKGKWSGFRKYPGPEPGGRGRFAWRGVLESRDEISAVLSRELEELIRIQGWAN
jgi:phage gpG-like protein